MKANIQQQLIDVLKTDGGKSSRDYAVLIKSDVREVQKALAELKRIGKAYSMPKTKNNGYSWHLNARDMGTLKYKITSQKWDGGINLG
jgi:hypothetical protein